MSPVDSSTTAMSPTPWVGLITCKSVRITNPKSAPDIGVSLIPDIGSAAIAVDARFYTPEPYALYMQVGTKV